MVNFHTNMYKCTPHDFILQSSLPLISLEYFTQEQYILLKKEMCPKIKVSSAKSHMQAKKMYSKRQLHLMLYHKYENVSQQQLTSM